MVLRRDGFGGSRYYPENSEISIICSYEDTVHRYVILQYMDLPFSYRQINRDGLYLLEEEVIDFLYKEIETIDAGYYDDELTALEIKKLMHVTK